MSKEIKEENKENIENLDNLDNKENKEKKKSNKIIYFLIVIVIIIIIADIIFVVISKNKEKEKGDIEVEYVSNTIKDITALNNEEVDANEETNTIKSKEDINYSENFNKQFSQYFGNVSGEKVIELLEIVSSNNKVNLTGNVSVNANFTSDVGSAINLQNEKDSNTIFSMRNYIDINKKYSISGISYSEDGYLSGISIND